MAHFSVVCWTTTRWTWKTLNPRGNPVPQRAWWMSHDCVWGRVKGTLRLPAGKLKFASLIQPFSASKERNHQVSFKEIDFCFLAKIFKSPWRQCGLFCCDVFLLTWIEFQTGSSGGRWLPLTYKPESNLISCGSACGQAVAPAVQLTQGQISGEDPEHLLQTSRAF